MFQSNLEYLVILLVLAIFVLATYSDEITCLAHKLEFWLSLGLNLFLGTALDLVAIHQHWWRFSSRKVCGLSLLGIPAEEFILFSLINLLAIAAWENTEK